MPLEIQEISIGMHVAGMPTLGAQGGASGSQAQAGESLDRDALVKECVRRVLQALNQTKDR